MNYDYTNDEKAQWILENGEPKIVWIFERVNNTIYKRPMSENLPPWISKERQVEGKYNQHTGYFE